MQGHGYIQDHAQAHAEVHRGGRRWTIIYHGLHGGTWHP
jgi:hypothetical protein